MVLRTKTLSALAVAFTLALLVALAAAPASNAAAPTGPSAEIIGGQPIVSDSTYPFLVAVLRNDDPVGGFYCGGSLISDRWVLTAAHCVIPSIGYTPKNIAIGSADRSSGAMQIIPVNQYYQHPDWNPDLVANDLMLLHLQHAPTGGLTPVTRATPAQDPADDVTTNVIGWGLTVVNSDGTDAPPNRANETSVEVVGTDACQSAWSGIASVTGNQICVLHKNPTQHSACNGDSGGPLLSGGRQVGIVSFGVGGCTAQAPEVMTRVSSYNSWIDGSMDKTLAPVDSASLSFGTVNVDKGTVTKSISFLSDGNQPITVFDAVASGDYKVSSSTCSGAIPPGQTCAISVTFNPSAGGIRDGGLTVNTDSQGTAHLTTSLTGMGLGRSNTPVKLHLTRSGAKYVGGKYKVSFRMNFKVPTGVPMAAACKGKLGLKMSVAGKHYSTKSKVGVVPPFLGRAPRCFTRFNFKVNASALGRKATLKLAFPKNEVLVASRSTKRFRIR